MRAPFAILFALAAARCARADSAYAYVPASSQDRDIGTITLREPPAERDIVLVGKALGTVVPAAGPLPVFSVEIAGGSSGEKPAPAPTPMAVPKGAIWPDSSGHFPAAAHPRGKDAVGDEANPWVPRGGPGGATVEAVIGCGGVIIGGEAGPVALVNGLAVKGGDTVGGFRVACVAREGAVLERAGALFVVPLGRVVTVTLQSR
jgi:hypothetical protein